MGEKIGMGFSGVLTLIFITLKLLGVIDWSWWWVLSPMWISWAVVLIVLVAVLAGSFLSEGGQR